MSAPFILSHHLFPLCIVVSSPPNSALQGARDRRPPRNAHVARAAVAAAAAAIRQGAAHVKGIGYAGRWRRIADN
jgi:hypothetical protein